MLARRLALDQPSPGNLLSGLELPMDSISVGDPVPVPPGAQLSPAEAAEVVFNQLPERDPWQIYDFAPLGGAQSLKRGRHGESAWKWIQEVAGPMPRIPPRLYRTVLHYTGAHYHEINQAMVLGTGGARAMAWAEQMREVMNSVTLPVALRLYRSSSPRWLHAVGQRFTADHLVSTSVDPRVAVCWQPAQPYPRRTLWAVDAPSGAHAIWGTPHNRAQAEVLLGSGTTFEVVDAVRNRKGDALMHLCVVV